MQVSPSPPAPAGRRHVAPSPGISSPQAEAPAPPPAGAPGAPSPSSGPGPPASHRGSTPQRPCTTPRAGRAAALISRPLPVLASPAPTVLTHPAAPGHASGRAALKGTGRESAQRDQRVLAGTAISSSLVPEDLTRSGHWSRCSQPLGWTLGDCREARGPQHQSPETRPSAGAGHSATERGLGGAPSAPTRAGQAHWVR